MKNIILTILMFSSLSLFGQDTLKHKVSLTFSGNVNEVNGKNKTLFSGNLTETAKLKKFETLLVTDYQLLSNDGVQSINDLSFRIQPRIIDKNYSVFVFGQASSLVSKKISERLEAGAGGGITLFRLANMETTISYGALYYSNVFMNGPEVKGFRHSPRFQVFGKVAGSKVSYFYEIYYQPNMKVSSDYISRSKATLAFELSKKFSINSSYTTWYESVFTKGAMNDIKTLTFGGSYKFE